jgi:predicted transcriptional regulator
MSTLTLPEQVHQIADTLSPGATWDDVRYQIELRASIERGLADSRAGRMIPVEDLLREFGIAE